MLRKSCPTVGQPRPRSGRRAVVTDGLREQTKKLREQAQKLREQAQKLR